LYRIEGKEQERPSTKQKGAKILKVIEIIDKMKVLC